VCSQRNSEVPLEVPESSPKAKSKEPRENQPEPKGHLSTRDRAFIAIYLTALVVTILIWLVPIRAPLRLDETGSYWQISAGFAGVWSRRLVSLCFPAYSYILWFSTTAIGTSEVALRIPSILAMLGAVYFLFLAARELFDVDIAIIAAIIFSLHPIVVNAAIDVRPYAFGVLATNATILLVLRLRRDDSNLMAALFGLSAAMIVWFHFLFADILPALVICFFLVKNGRRKTLWRQLGVALTAFSLASLPVIPDLLSLFHGAGTHVFETTPTVKDMFWTFVPGRSWKVFGMFAFVTAALAAWVGTRNRSGRSFQFQGSTLFVCLSLALIPTLILYGLSVGTSIHAFVPRHRIDAIPGIALCWAMLLHASRSRAGRLLLCAAFVAVTAYIPFSSSSPAHHGDTWKFALQAAERNATADNAPVVICSDFPEADSAAMPVDSAKESILFAPLSYYRLRVPVVPLPRALNDEAIRVGSLFLAEAAKKHERFLALAYLPSYRTLDWLAKSATETYSVRKSGVYDGIELLEFVPRSIPSLHCPARRQSTRNQ